MGHQIVLKGADAALLVYVVFVGLGLVNCFFGYRLFKVLLGIWGFVGGAAITMGLLQGVPIEPIMRILGAVLGGVVGAVLVSVLYVVGVFFFGASFGLLVAAVIQQHVHIAPTWLPMAILAALGGIAALALQRPLIMLFTAFGGAWIVVACAASLVAGCSLETFPAHCVRASPWALVILAAWLLLGFFGLATQSRLGRGPGRHGDDD